MHIKNYFDWQNKLKCDAKVFIERENIEIYTIMKEKVGLAFKENNQRFGTGFVFLFLLRSKTYRKRSAINFTCDHEVCTRKGIKRVYRT